MASFGASNSTRRDGKFWFMRVPPCAMTTAVLLSVCTADILHPVAMCPLYLHPPSDEIYKLLLLLMKASYCGCFHVNDVSASSVMLQHLSADLLSSR